jgi:putative transposase
MVFSDSGVELTSNILWKWQQQRRGAWRYSMSGKPMQTGFVESVNGRPNDECLHGQLFVGRR